MSTQRATLRGQVQEEFSKMYDDAELSVLLRKPANTGKKCLLSRQVHDTMCVKAGAKKKNGTIDIASMSDLQLKIVLEALVEFRKAMLQRKDSLSSLSNEDVLAAADQCIQGRMIELSFDTLQTLRGWTVGEDDAQFSTRKRGYYRPPVGTRVLICSCDGYVECEFVPSRVVSAPPGTQVPARCLVTLSPGLAIVGSVTTVALACGATGRILWRRILVHPIEIGRGQVSEKANKALRRAQYVKKSDKVRVREDFPQVAADRCYPWAKEINRTSLCTLEHLSAWIGAKEGDQDECFGAYDRDADKCHDCWNSLMCQSATESKDEPKEGTCQQPKRRLESQSEPTIKTCWRVTTPQVSGKVAKRYFETESLALQFGSKHGVTKPQQVKFINVDGQNYYVGAPIGEIETEKGIQQAVAARMESFKKRFKELVRIYHDALKCGMKPKPLSETNEVVELASQCGFGPPRFVKEMHQLCKGNSKRKVKAPPGLSHAK